MQETDHRWGEICSRSDRLRQFVGRCQSPSLKEGLTEADSRYRGPSATRVAPKIAVLIACLLTSCAPGPDRELPVSRLFAGHGDYEPWDFAAYGILAFQSEVDEDSRDRYRLFCESFLTTFVTATRVESAGTPLSEQMVTIWPLLDSDLAYHLNSHTGAGLELVPDCTEIIDAIDLQRSHDAIRATKTSLAGRGPYLLAWAPGCAFDKTDNVLLVDLSRVDTLDEASAEFIFWRDEIQKDTELWSQGWNTDRVLMKVAKFFVRRTDAIMEALGLAGIVASP